MFEKKCSVEYANRIYTIHYTCFALVWCFSEFHACYQPIWRNSLSLHWYLMAIQHFLHLFEVFLQPLSTVFAKPSHFTTWYCRGKEEILLQFPVYYREKKCVLQCHVYYDGSLAVLFSVMLPLHETYSIGIGRLAS